MIAKRFDLKTVVYIGEKMSIASVDEIKISKPELKEELILIGAILSF